MITHIIKPGTVFFFNQSKLGFDLQAGVLMVATDRLDGSKRWRFRHLAKTFDHKAMVNGEQTAIFFHYDNPKIETIIGQLPPDELHVTEWKPEYLLSKRIQPGVTLSSRAVGLLKRLW